MNKQIKIKKSKDLEKKKQKKLCKPINMKQKF